MNLRAFFAVLLIPSRVFAEEPALPVPAVVTFPPGDDNIAAVKKGEPAPYAGQLFDENTALRWALWLQQYKTRYGLDLKAEKDSCKVIVAREQEYRRIDAERSAKVEEDLRKRLLLTEKARLEAEERLRNPPLWKEPALWYAVGVVSTAVLVVLVEEKK